MRNTSDQETQINRRSALIGSASLTLVGLSGCTGGGGNDASSGSNTTADTEATEETETGTDSDEEAADSDRTENNQNWPMVRATPENTGYAGTTGPFGEPGELERLWQKPGTTIPIVANGTVYVADGAHISGHESSSGELQTEIPSKGGIAPAYSDGTILTGVGSSIYAFDSESGDEQWQSGVGTSVGSSVERIIPLDPEGIALALLRGGDITSLDMATGEELWSFNEGQPGPDSDISVAVHDGEVYTTAEKLVTLDLQTGEVRNEMEPPEGVRFYSPPAYHDGALFVSGSDGQFYSIDTDSYTVQWQTQTGEVSVSPAVDPEGVYFVDDSGVLYKCDVSSGEELWRATVGFQLFMNPPVVSTEAVYVTKQGGGTQENIAVYDKDTGDELYRGALPAGDLYSPIVPAHGSLYYCSSSNSAVYDVALTSLDTSE